MLINEETTPKTKDVIFSKIRQDTYVTIWLLF